jgi:hypothetical protein
MSHTHPKSLSQSVNSTRSTAHSAENSQDLIHGVYLVRRTDGTKYRSHCDGDREAVVAYFKVRSGQSHECLRKTDLLPLW